MPQQMQTVDEFHIDVLDATSKPSMGQISIGTADAGLHRVFQFNYDDSRDNFLGRINQHSFSNGNKSVGYDPLQSNTTETCVNLTLNGGNTASYRGRAIVNGACSYGSKKIVYENNASPAEHIYMQVLKQKYTFINEGVEAVYDGKYRFSRGTGFQDQGALTSVKEADGERLTYYYQPSDSLFYRVQSIVSNYGYMLRYDYYDGDSLRAPYGNSTLKSITAINLSVDYCEPLASSCSYSHTWPTWLFDARYENYGYGYELSELKKTLYEVAVDPNGGQYNLSFDQFRSPMGRVITRNTPSTSIFKEEMRPAGSCPAWDTNCEELDESTSNSVCTAYDFKFCIDGPFTVTHRNGTWSYNFNSRASTIPGLNPDAVMTVTNPVGGVKTIHSFRLKGSSEYVDWGRRVGSIVDENGKVTNYEYELKFGHLSQITYPEGNKTQFTYDNRGNLIERRDLPKPGSTLEPLIWTAGYLADPCTNPVVCNKPLWVREPVNNSPSIINEVTFRTDYKYDTIQGHGGVIEETRPRDANGGRPQTRFEYALKYAKYKPSAGAAPVPYTDGIYKLVKTSTCSYATTPDPAWCINQNRPDKELVTEYIYDAEIYPNLLLVAKIVRAGNANVNLPYNAVTNVWQKTTYGYDNVGNTIWVDGPLPGDVDKTYTFYDVLRRPILEIGADPDGAGSNSRPFVQHTYNADGQEILTEKGIVTAATIGASPPPNTSLPVSSFVRNTFDLTTGLLTKTETGTIEP